METGKNISEELRQISPTVADISRHFPYEVPIGYFEGFAGQMLAVVKNRESSNVPEGIEVSGVLDKIGKKPVYSLPAGYFDSFAERIMEAIHAREAAEELATLSPLLQGLRKQPSFQVPEGYFSDLAHSAVSGVKAIEFVNDELEKGELEKGGLEKASSLPADLKNKPTYQVPDGYFEGLTGNIIEAVKSNQSARIPVISLQANGVARGIPVAEQSAKVISFNTGRRKWRYAAAAVVATILLTGSWLLFRPSGAGRTIGRNGGDILSLNNWSKVSNEEIENYLDNHNISNEAGGNSLASLDFNNDNDIRNMLGEVPDDELRQYLDDHGTSGDQGQGKN